MQPAPDQTRPMDMNALAARVTARRAAAGLISSCGIACANAAEKEYRDFRHEMTKRDDWCNLPADLHERLVSLHAAQK